MKKLLPNQLLLLLGTFWSSVFNSKNLLKNLFKGVISSHEQSEVSVTELVTGVSNKEVSAGQRTPWHKFVFNAKNSANVTYGNPNSTYGVSYVYGELDGTAVTYVIPNNIIDIPFLYDDIVNPTRMLCRGVDYVIESGKIKFFSPLTYGSSDVVLYARNMREDTGFVHSRLGHLIDANMSDKVFNKVPFKLLWRMSTYGASYADFMQLIGYCSDTPTTAERETVLAIANLNLCTLVITDFNCYAVPNSQQVSVSVDDVLPPGTFLGSGAKLLHNKQTVLDQSIPGVVNGGYVFKYGNQSASASAMIILQADIKGELAGALRLLKRTLPLESKVFIFGHRTLPSPPTVSFSGSVAPAVGVTVPAAVSGLQIQAKTMAKLQYNYSGY
jgi:hypothetical protein